MLYLTLPLALALAAAVGVWVVIGRKASFLRKLTPESHEVGDTWLHDMAPEVVDWFRNVPWRQYLHTGLGEFEKFLRRTRLVFSAIDRLSERLVRKVRHVHQESARQVQQEQLQVAKEGQVDEQEQEIDTDDPEQLKLQEQQLIVAIAQAPKEPGLYSDLARVYLKMRNFTDAVEALAAAVKLEPENADYQRRLESAKRRAAQVPVV